MVATLSQYRSQLIEWLGQYSDDSVFSYRYLEDQIIVWTNKWFCNTYEKFSKDIPELYYQTLECVEIEQADQADCCEFETGCTIMRTKREVPAFRALSDGELFVKAWPVSVYQSQPTNLFDIIDFERADGYGNLRYNANRIAAFYYKNRVYLISKDFPTISLIDKINIRGIFRDPRDTAPFMCANKPCWTPLSPFQLEERLWTYVFTDLTNDLLQKLKNPQDRVNNANDQLDAK